MERMNYINKDKNYMTDAERIRYLEESIRELRKEKENLKKEKGELKSRLEKENKKLKEENEYRKKIADVLPEGEGHIAEETIQDLQKEIKLLKMSLEEKDENCYGLAKENKNLKEDVDYFRQCYLDLKKLCEKEGFIPSDEEVIKMFNLDKIK